MKRDRVNNLGLVGLVILVAAAIVLVRRESARDQPPVPVSTADAARAPDDDADAEVPSDAASGSTSACAAIAALVADAGVSVSDVAGAVPLADACLLTQKGAWGVVVTRVTEPAKDVDPCNEPIEVSFAIVHVDEAGHIARAPRKTKISPCDRDVVRTASVGDLDGDGEDELVIPYSHEGPGGADEGPIREVGKIFAFRNGAIADVTHGLQFHDARDVDGDGRVDLVTFSPYEITLAQGGCMVVERAVPGPALLLHSLADGGFSRDDDVAKGFARTQCASRPKHLVLSQDGGLEQQETAVANIACAKLWGVAEARVADQIANECATSEKLGVALGQGDNSQSDCFTATGTEICLDGGIAWPSPPVRLDR